MGCAFGVEIAVSRIEHGADKIFLFQKRVQFFGFRHRKHFRFQTQIAGAGMGHFQPFHALFAIGQNQTARAMQPAGLAGNLLQLIIKPNRVTLQLGDIGIAVQGVKAARCMPCGTRGENIAFDQNHIFPTGLGEMIEHRTPHDAATNHHHARTCFHFKFLSGQNLTGMP